MVDETRPAPSTRSGMKPARRPPHRQSHPLTDDEREGILVAVRSVFRKLKNLHDRMLPVYVEFGFRAPSPGVLARDLSEKVETSIVQHCDHLSARVEHADLQRQGRPWEVKICKASGLTINQSKVVLGENYIVVNYYPDSKVAEIWVLWDAEDAFFTDRRPNSNARTVDKAVVADHVEVLLARTAPSKKRRP